MKEDVKQRWVAALRSGEFNQGRCYLVRTDPDSPSGQSHCCLGVLERVERLARDPDRLNDNQLLCDAAIEQVGLTRDEQERLAVMNDAERATFDEIATYIEGNL